MIRPETLIDRQRRISARIASSVPPERYFWIGLWWRVSARMSANPAAKLSYARAQLSLAKDMAIRPDYYRTKPSHKTDWQWSGLGTEENPA